MNDRRLLMRLARGDVRNVRFDALCRLVVADEGYIADIPDLNACSAFGETPQQAVEQVVDARDAWLAVARETGRDIPPPRYRPAIDAG